MIRIRETILKFAAVALTALALPLLSACAENGTGETPAAASNLGGSEQKPIKGLHGGRLLEEDDFQVEVTIYERGIPPEFRVYAFKSKRPIDPAELQLTVELSRLGGRVDVIAFRKVDDYLLGDMVVEEPHSFDVKLIAERKGRTYRREYSQIEARTELSPEAVQGSGIVIEEAGAVQMKSVFELPGEIAFNPDRVAHVVPRFGGVVTEVRKNLGAKVSKGEVIAVVDSRELASFQLAYIQAYTHWSLPNCRLKGKSNSGAKTSHPKKNTWPRATRSKKARSAWTGRNRHLERWGSRLRRSRPSRTVTIRISRATNSALPWTAS